MSYDDIIVLTGGFGKYQLRTLLLLFIPVIITGFHTMSGVFLNAVPDFRCLLPFEDSYNSSYQIPSHQMNLFYPLDDATGSWSQCERYDLDYTNEYADIDGNLSSVNSTVKCESYIYDKTTYDLTTVTEFNFVCDKAWVTALASSLFVVGLMMGTVIFGTLSDKYGRRPTLCLALATNLLTGFLQSAAPETISYIIFRMMLGTSLNAMYLITFVLGVEMVVPTKRSLTGILVQSAFTFGYILITGFAYFITNWRILQIAITIPSFICLVYWWLIPESVRWLLSNDRSVEARESILKTASANGVKVSTKTLDGMLSNIGVNKPASKKLSFFVMMKYPNLRKRTLLLFFIWFVNNATYYGLSWNTSSLGGNDYVNFAIAGFVEVPAHLFIYFTQHRFRIGRRITLCGCLLLVAASLLSMIFVPSDMSWLKTVLVMIGKCAITASFGILYFFTTEQYPTVIRNVAIGACSGCGRIGSIVAPFITYSSRVWTPFPHVLFGTGTLIAGLTTLLLPETTNKKLPETMQDGENLGNRDYLMEDNVDMRTGMMNEETIQERGDSWRS